MILHPDSEQTPVRPRLLLVDDDAGVRAAVSRFLRRYRFDVTTAPDAESGLLVLQQSKPFQVIISDYRMPGMTGSQFLGRVAELYPSTRRMILSGYADNSLLLSAINDGNIHRYLTKPWESRELLATIRELVDEFHAQDGRHEQLQQLTDTNRRLEENLRKYAQRLEAQGRRVQETNHRLRLLAAHVEKVREDERRSIARNVHDDLGQTLTAMNLELAAMLQAASDVDLRPRLRDLRQLVDGAIGTVQRIIADTRPPILDELGLEEALADMLHKKLERCGIRCILSCTLPVEALPEVLVTCLYRVAQEALTNILRHAGATKVLVTLRHRDGWCQLQIRDNGCGVREDQAAAADSFGLMGMRERVAQHGGSFSISPRPGGGTIVEAQIPYLTKEINDEACAGS